MENIKIGSVVFWNKSGARVFWRTNVNDIVDFLSEEFLEGDSNDGHPYSQQFAYDVPNQGQSIDPSLLDATAGTITGKLEEKDGINFYPLSFPFTFRNLDGDNHDDSSKTLKVYVNADDISTETSKMKKDRETKAIVDEALKIEPLTNQVLTQKSDSKPKSTWIIIVLIIIIIIVGILLLISSKKNQESNSIYYPNTDSNGQSFTYMNPQNTIYSINN